MCRYYKVIMIGIIGICFSLSAQYQWSKIYVGGGDHEGVWNIRPTPDGGYIIEGETFSFGGYKEMFVMKLNYLGEVEWARTYGDQWSWN